MTEIGTWIKNEKLYPFHNCSECNYTTYVQTPYCPNCGRKMEIIEEDVQETAKIFKISGYIVDMDGQMTKEKLEIYFNNSIDNIEIDEFFIQNFNVEERDIGEWDDDNPLNLIACPVEECEKYFT